MEHPIEKAALGGAALVNQSQADITKIPAETQVLNPNQRALKAALSLAERGIPSFPCLDSKAPACPGGFKAATADSDALYSLRMQYPGPLVGVPTGAVSGVDVLDIDAPKGGSEWLAKNAANLPITRTHDTRSGGWHLLFKHRSGLRNSASKIALGVDVRGDGGYIIWWPAAGLGVQNQDTLADWPEWLLAQLEPPKPERRTYQHQNQPISDAYIGASLRRGALRVANAPEGQRNTTLNAELWSLARFIETGRLHPQTLANCLAEAAAACGLRPHEIRATIASALRARGV